MSRDKPLKAPRFIEPRPIKTTSAGSRQSTDVTADVIVHKARQVETEPPMQTASVTSQQTDAQQRTAITTTDKKQCVEEGKDSNTVPPQKRDEQSNKDNKISHLEESGLNASVDVTKSRTMNTDSQPIKLLTPVLREPPEKPAKAKPKQGTSSTENTPDSKVQKSTQVLPVKMEVKAIQSKPLPSEPSPSLKLQLDQVQPKRTPVQATPSSTDKIRRDMFQVRVKNEQVKSSPVKAQSKPRRQTRATLAYDRVMFFSDFFRRLESDRRLFALPPVRRNRVYVSPRAEDASTAPVKFPRPSATKKGRIGVVSATRSSGIRSSPFTTKRRLPTQAWDHKIDLESIEADATLITQLSQNQWNGVDQQLVSLEAPRQSKERSIHQGQVTAKADNTKVLHVADTTANAESAFTCATKHSAKMRRRLKRKQRKRSITSSEGIEGRVPDMISSSSGEGTPVHHGDDRSKRGSKKESRSSTKHCPTNSITSITVTEIPPGPSLETDKSTDRRLHSLASCPVLTVQQKPMKSPIHNEVNVSGTPSPRGKTMVEILSHIGEQITSNENETMTSPQPEDTADPGQESCTVSVVVVSDDTAGRTVSGSDSTLQWTISHLSPSCVEDTAAEEKDISTTESRKKSRELERPGSSASTVTRLSVTKDFGDGGQSLRRSHSCAEMRRRMVLTEWEVVTTTNTKVTVTETGPPSQPMDSEKERFGDDIKAGFLLDTQVAEQNSSRNQTLGLAKNLTGHRRSKSSDSRIQRHVADETHSVSRPNPDEAGHPYAKVCEEHHVGSRSHHETDTGNFPVLSTGDKLPVQQSSELVDNDSAKSQTPGVSSANQLSLPTESGCETTLTQPEVPVIVTYTLNEPLFVDAVRSTEMGWEDRWTTGSNADRIRDYTLVNVIEKIRLHTVGNEPDHRTEDQMNEIVFETIPVTDCSDVLSPEPHDDGGGLCEEAVTQPSQVPGQLHCQQTAEENGAADQQSSICMSAVQDDDIHDKSEVVNEGQERQDTLTTTEQIDTTKDSPAVGNQRTDFADSVLPSNIKEDEDSEEKEEDEAENGQAEGDETDEKGMLELSARTIEKNGDMCEESADTGQSVEQLDCENMTESQTVVTAVDNGSHECSEQPAMTKEPGQDEVRGGGSVMNNDEVQPNDELSYNVSVMKGMAVSSDVAEPGGQLDLTSQSEHHSQSYGQRDETVQSQYSQSDTFGSSVGPSPASESHIADTESCPVQEPDRTCSTFMTSEFDPDTQEGRDIQCEICSTECGKHAEAFPAAETSQVLTESVTDEQQVMTDLNDNTPGEYRISNVEELISADTMSIWNHDRPIDVEPVQLTTANEHSSMEHAKQTGATSTNDAGDFGNRNFCVSNGVGTLYDESFTEIADNPMRSHSTFAHEGAQQESKVTISVEEDFSLTLLDCASVR